MFSPGKDLLSMLVSVEGLGMEIVLTPPRPAASGGVSDSSAVPYLRLAGPLWDGSR